MFTFEAGRGLVPAQNKPAAASSTFCSCVMDINSSNPQAIEKKRIWLAMIPPIVLVVTLWLVAVVNETILPGDVLGQYGIFPRRLTGLRGILFSPFIHSSFSHLFSNTLPLFILLWCIFYFYAEIAYHVTGVLWVLSGFLTWVIGRDSYHVGASGLVFALFSFLFFSGIFRRHIPLISVSLMVAFIYGSTIWSIFPVAEYVDADISWEAHLSGFVSGLIVAAAFRKQGPQKPPEEEETPEEEDESGSGNEPETITLGNDPFCIDSPN